MLFTTITDELLTYHGGMNKRIDAGDRVTRDRLLHGLHRSNASRRSGRDMFRFECTEVIEDAREGRA